MKLGIGRNHLGIVTCFMFFISIGLFAQNSIPAPEKLKVKQVSHKRVTICWDVPEKTELIRTFKIYRNNIHVGSSVKKEFTDSGLKPGTVYSYKVKGVGDYYKCSDFSNEVITTTLKPLDTENTDIIEKLANKVNPLNGNLNTSKSLIFAVKSGLEAIFNTNINFSQNRISIFEKFVHDELTEIKDSSDKTKFDEKKISKELHSFLNYYYGENKFEDVYLNSKLNELAERYWQNQDVKAATQLNELSFDYLKDREEIVYTTLARLAHYKKTKIYKSDDRQEIVNLLHGHAAQYERFFTFFPNSFSYYALASRNLAMMEYFRYFPVLLDYNSYEHTIFNAALLLSEKSEKINNDVINLDRCKRVAAWKLGSINVKFNDKQGKPISGSLDVVNISDKSYFWNYDANKPPIRCFSLSSKGVTVPVYLGHQYDFIASFDVPGGPPQTCHFRNIHFAQGERTIYNGFNKPYSEDLDGNLKTSEMVFITSKPDYPYNLRANVSGNTFDLSWNWSNPKNDFKLDHFRVYQGGIEIGRAKNKKMEKISIISPPGIKSSYTVRACSESNTLSPSSQELMIMPPGEEALAQAYISWKEKYFGMEFVFAHQDTDLDGLTNWDEFCLSTNPAAKSLSDPKEGAGEIITGIAVKYFNITEEELPDFDALTPFATKILKSFSFNTESAILTSSLESELGLVCEGFLDVPKDGNYWFYLTSSDGSRLIINNDVVIDNNGVHSEKEMRSKIFLKKGSNKIRIEYFNLNSKPAVLDLQWSGSDFSQTDIMPSIWVTDSNNTIEEEVAAWQRDSDNDGIRDVEEYKQGTSFNNEDTDGDGLTDYEEINIYHTNPNKIDSDGDGINDYDEIKMVFSDPNVVDFNGENTVISTINGSDIVSSSTGWEKSGSAIYAVSRNGYLEYKLEIKKDGSYALEIAATQHNYLASENSFHIKLYIDGKYIAANNIEAPYGTIGTGRYFLPDLKKGSHSVKLVWENIDSSTFLQVNSIKLLNIGGPDKNSNNIADWLDNRINNLSLVIIPQVTKTSPICIEGANAALIGNITINGFFTKPGEEPEAPLIIHGAKNKWYSDVNLNPKTPTTLTVSFDNDAKKVIQTVKWEITNISTEDEIIIRRGDSLKLSMVTENPENGSVSITVDGELQTLQDNICVYEFEQAGSFLVKGKFSATTGEIKEGELLVKVVGASFAGIPYALVNVERSWDNPCITNETELEHDDSISIAHSITGSGSEISFSGNNPGKAYIVARLGEDGPIMSSTCIDILAINTHKNEGYYKSITTFNDGDRKSVV